MDQITQGLAQGITSPAPQSPQPPSAGGSGNPPAPKKLKPWMFVALGVVLIVIGVAVYYGKSTLYPGSVGVGDGGKNIATACIKLSDITECTAISKGLCQWNSEKNACEPTGADGGAQQDRARISPARDQAVTERDRAVAERAVADQAQQDAKAQQTALDTASSAANDAYKIALATLKLANTNLGDKNDATQTAQNAAGEAQKALDAVKAAEKAGTLEAANNASTQAQAALKTAKNAQNAVNTEIEKLRRENQGGGQGQDGGGRGDDQSTDPEKICTEKKGVWDATSAKCTEPPDPNAAFERECGEALQNGRCRHDDLEFASLDELNIYRGNKKDCLLKDQSQWEWDKGNKLCKNKIAEAAQRAQEEADARRAEVETRVRAETEARARAEADLNNMRGQIADLQQRLGNAQSNNSSTDIAALTQQIAALTTQLNQQNTAAASAAAAAAAAASAAASTATAAPPAVPAPTPAPAPAAAAPAAPQEPAVVAVLTPKEAEKQKEAQKNKAKSAGQSVAAVDYALPASSGSASAQGQTQTNVAAGAAAGTTGRNVAAGSGAAGTAASSGASADAAKRLHGAYIQGRTGPGILIYPFAIAGANGLYYLLRRRRKKQK